MMKRVFAVLLVSALALCAYGCGGGLPTDRLDVQAPAPTLTTQPVNAATNSNEYDASNATYITLADDNINVQGNGVLQGDNFITIADAGVFVLTGKLSNGYILIDADKLDEVQLVLNGVDIICSNYAAIAAMQSAKLTITLPTGSVNSLCDGDAYTVETEEANGCIFSNDNIIFDGGGTLNIVGNYNNAIASDDDIKVKSGTLNLTCVNDALNANEKIRILGGEVNISAGDDAMHSNELLEVSGGKVNIIKSYEGLESAAIDISGGEVNITAQDDGINGAGGADASGTATATAADAKRGKDMFASDGSSITVSGGIVNIDAGGDGIDSNGDFTITGGEVYISGPTNDGNTALDYNGTAVISGGIFAAAGSAGMAQGFGDSPQCSVMITYSIEQQAGATVSLKNSSGATVVSYTPAKKYSSIILSAPELVLDGVYTLYSNETKLMEYTQSSAVMSLSDSGEAVSGKMMGGAMMGGRPSGDRPDAMQPGSATNVPQPPPGSATNAPQPGNGMNGTPPDGTGTPPEPRN